MLNSIKEDELSDNKTYPDVYIKHSSTVKILDTSCSETDLLIPKKVRSDRPRMSSIFFMVDSWFVGGIVTRANYMTQCFNTVWSAKSGVRCLRYLLWNFKVSKDRRFFALLGLGVQWIIPFLPLLLFVDSVRRSELCNFFIFSFLILELLLFVWYIIVLHVVITNGNEWERSWFTFELPCGTIGLLERNSSHGLTLFYSRANIRFLKIQFSRIFQLEHISKIQQKFLIQNMRCRNMTKAEIILYTDDFVYCYNRWPKMMSMGLLISTGCGLLLVYYFLGKI